MPMCLMRVLHKANMLHSYCFPRDIFLIATDDLLDSLVVFSRRIKGKKKKERRRGR